MPSKRGKRKPKKGRKPQASQQQQAASNNHDADNKEKDEEVTEGERLLAEAFLADSDMVGRNLMELMEHGGMDPDTAVDELTKSLSLMAQAERGEKPATAYKDKSSRRLCDRDGCDKNGVLNCSQCKCHFYCDKDCQRQAWKVGGHKHECKHLQQCRERVPQVPRDTYDYSLEIGVARTKNHGSHIFCMGAYKRTGVESDRSVPLATVSVDGDPTVLQATSCLIDAILYPEFDTEAAGARRPYFVSVQAESFGDQQVAERLAAICRRLGIVIKNMGAADDITWSTSWLCVQNGWNEELTSPRFLQTVSADRRHPLEPNGFVRKELSSTVDRWNERAAASARRPQEDLASLRERVMKLPCEQGPMHSLGENVLSIAVHEGVLYISSRQHELLFHQPVLLDKVTHRPSPDFVLGAYYKVLLEATKRRPLTLYLGQPSICSYQDVEVYEEALNHSIVRDACRMAMVDNLEDNLASFHIPRWRMQGLLDTD